MSSRMQLPKGEEEIIINMWHERPCLWDITHKDYMNKRVRDQQRQEIADAVGWNPFKLIEKLKTLKDSYVRAWKKYIFGASNQSLRPGTREAYYIHNLHFLEESVKIRRNSGKTMVKTEKEDPQSDDVQYVDDDSNSEVYQDQLSKDGSASFQDGAFQDRVSSVIIDSDNEASQEEVLQNDMLFKDNISHTEGSNSEVSHTDAVQSSSATTNPATASLLSLKRAYESSVKQTTKRKRAKTETIGETHNMTNPFTPTPTPVAIFASASASAETNRETVDSTQSTQEERMHAANELFGSYIAESLSGLSSQARNWCIMEINNAIFKAQSGMWCQQLSIL